MAHTLEDIHKAGQRHAIRTFLMLLTRLNITRLHGRKKEWKARRRRYFAQSGL
jgi:hypothetical protein